MKPCEKCNKEHDGAYGSGRFCSSKCARGFSTTAKREEINEKVSATLTGRPDPRKGNPIFWSNHLSPESRAKQVVSLNVYYRNKLQTWAQHWLSDTSFNPPRNSTLRRSIILLRGEKCERCNWCEKNPYTNRIPLQIHHVDGDDHNNRPENVVLLCPNCHTLTENWGARNRRKFPDPNPRR